MLTIVLFRLWMLVMLAGVCVAVWGFSRSDKSGYILVAIFFVLMLALFLYTGPFVSEPADPELQAKINQAITEVMQAEKAGSEGTIHAARISTRLSVIPTLLSFIASVILVVGLWLLARADAKGDTEKAAPPG